jgi:type IV pilus assembly protein PilM
MAKTQVAVEITEESVRAVEMTSGRTPTMIAAGEVPLPPGAAKDSEIVDRDAVALALQRLWAESRISSRDVVLGVGNRRILVREHTTTLTNPVHIRQSLPFEVQDRLPVPVDQAVLDFVPTAQDEHGVHGLLVAAVAEHMEELVGALDGAKLRATSVDLVAFGYARALAGLVPEGRTGMFVGIGEHTTHIVIATGGVPRFVRVVPIDIVAPAPATPEGERMPATTVDGRFDALVAGVEMPDELHGLHEELVAVAAGPGVADSSAALRERRRGRGSTGPTPLPAAGPPAQAAAGPFAAPAPRPLHPEVEAALIDLVGRLRGTVSFYRDRPDASPIDVTFVSGSYAAHPKLLDAVGRVTGTPVSPLTAFDLVRPAGTVATMPPAVAARMTGTVALLLGGVR